MPGNQGGGASLQERMRTPVRRRSKSPVSARVTEY
jgi:hypothetical protein